MNFNHRPVMLKECIEYLDIKPEGTYIDCTLGGAGHTEEIYIRLNKKGTLLATDKDEDAIEYSTKKLSEVAGKAKLILIKSDFKNIKQVCIENKIDGADGILLDLGVSSYQLDTPERGFSYMNDAPLDMRMDKETEITAETIVNEYDKNKIKCIIRDYGEEKWAARIAEFIVEARKKNRITTTGELVKIIKAAIPSKARQQGHHPAKRTFQALRIEVNDELEVLEKTISDLIAILKPKGRLCIITFHSLEDRIVKNEFVKALRPCTCPSDFPMCVCGKKPTVKNLTRKPIIPEETEREENPRARSSKLRVVEKI